MPIGFSSATQPWASRLSRRGCLFCLGCCWRGSLLARRTSSLAAEKIFSSAAAESVFCNSIGGLAVVTVIIYRPNRARDLSAPQVFAVISRYVPLLRIGRRCGSESQEKISG